MRDEVRYFLPDIYIEKGLSSGRVFRYDRSMNSSPMFAYFDIEEKAWMDSESLARDVMLGSGGFEEISREAAEKFCPEAFAD